MTTDDEEEESPHHNDMYRIPITVETLSWDPRTDRLHTYTREKLVRTIVAELEGDQDWVEINDQGYVNKRTLVKIVAHLATQ